MKEEGNGTKENTISRVKKVEQQVYKNVKKCSEKIFDKYIYQKNFFYR